MPRMARSFLAVSGVVILCSLVGGIVGPELAGVSAASEESDVQAGVRSFSKVYDLIEQNFADKVHPDKAIYRGAIPGMLRTLDPHSEIGRAHV